MIKDTEPRIVLRIQAFAGGSSCSLELERYD